MHRCIKTLHKNIDQALDKIIDEHKQDVKKDPTNHMNFIEVMVSLMNSKIFYSGPLYMIENANIKAIIIEVLVGSIETLATAIEWILSKLLRHPK